MARNGYLLATQPLGLAIFVAPIGLAAMAEFTPDLAIGTTPVVQKAKEVGIPSLYFTNLISARPLMGPAGAGSLTPRSLLTQELSELAATSAAESKQQQGKRRGQAAPMQPMGQRRWA